MGGPQMIAAGADVIQPFEEVAVMGLSEVIGALPAVFRIRRKLGDFLKNEKVDLLVPIDFPGFNGGVADKAKKLGIPVFWLIAPQHWAWGGWRTRAFRGKVSRLGTILPFETEFFRSRGLDVFPMGHPLMEDYGGVYSFQKMVDHREKNLSDREGHLTIGVFPGSRQQELKHLLPTLKVTCQALVGLVLDREIKFLISAAPGVDPQELSSAFAISAEIVQAPLHEVFPQVDLALVCSGTASLEAALAGVPHELVYKTGALNHWIGMRLIRTGRIGLSNIILDEDLIREHLQNQATPLSLASNLLRWISRPSERQRFYKSVKRLRRLCGEPGVWERTAREILDLLGKSTSDSSRSGV